jgi:hypothetical protein
MIFNRPTIGLLAAALSPLLLSAPCRAQGVKVVNIIPPNQSPEHVNNPEPHLAIKTVAADSLVVTAHLPGAGWCKFNSLSGYFVSTDGGSNWKLVCAPALVAAPLQKPGDLTTRFTGESDWLHISNLLPPTGLNLLGSKLMTSGASATDVLDGTLGSTAQMDQPQLRTRPKAGENEIAIAVVDRDYNSTAAGSPCFYVRFLWAKQTTDPLALRSECIAARDSDIPFAPRVAVHPDGVMYAAFLRVRWQEDPMGGYDRAISDVVVVRGKPSAPTGYALDALVEPTGSDPDPCAPSDGRLGIRVVRCVDVPFDGTHNPAFGWEVRRGSLALSVDPTDWKKVYVAWGDNQPDTLLTLHVRRSVDGGETWDATDLFMVERATNPALAVDTTGRVALLYQQFVPGTGNGRWHSRLRWTAITATPAADIILADTPAGASAPPISPYQGDYVDLVAVRAQFFGVFSARNDPTTARFPYGVKYNRKCSGGFLRRKTGQFVAASVDPFFFRVRPEGSTPPVQGTGLDC